MDPIRRSKPFWRSALAPLSLGLLWPSLIGGIWFFILSEFGNPLPADALNLSLSRIQTSLTTTLDSDGEASAPELPLDVEGAERDLFDPGPTQEQAGTDQNAESEGSTLNALEPIEGFNPVALSEGGVTVGGTPTHALVSIHGELMVDEPMTHLGALKFHPDGSLVAFDLIPTGSETASLGQIKVFDLERVQEVASFAGFGPDWDQQAELTFYTPDFAAATYDMVTGEIFEHEDRSAMEYWNSPPMLNAQSVLEAQSAPEYFHPLSIRVRHLEYNYCRRGVPDNEVMEIPFEEYVARVLPAEVSPNWGMEALKAQAIVVRTYAWNKIRANRSGAYPFDISDWTNNQVMCDYRHSRTDQAAYETAGMILNSLPAQNTLPINTMYSAENAHPTVKHRYLSYLDSVADPNALGRKRNGHGWGLSQWGAKRLADQGLNYCQILGHYYQLIGISNFGAPETPLGCLLINGGSGYTNGTGVLIRPILSSGVSEATLEISEVLPPSPATPQATEPEPAATPAAASDAPISDVQPAADAEPTAIPTAETPPPAEAETPPDDSTPPEAEATPEVEVADPNPLPLPVTLPIARDPVLWQIPEYIASGTELQFTLRTEEHVLHTTTVMVDRESPGWLNISFLSSNSAEAIPMAVSAAPGDGVSVGYEWSWEQSSLQFTENSGGLSEDAMAVDGLVWTADPADHDAGTWYGPYTSMLPAELSYRALFRLKVPEILEGAADEFLDAEPIARLDVMHEGGTRTLGFRLLYATDFTRPAEFQNFGVDFHLFEELEDVEFRVHWMDSHTLTLDQVTVVSVPYWDWSNSNIEWPISSTSTGKLSFTVFDPAGNMSSLTTLGLDRTGRSQNLSILLQDCSLFGQCNADGLYPEAGRAVE